MVLCPSTHLRMPTLTSPDLQHILLVVSDMGAGGAQRAAVTLANGLVDRGHRVALIETFSEVGDCVYSISPLVERIRWATPGRRSGATLTSRIARLLWLRALLRDRPGAVVISFLTDVNVAMILASVKMPVPVIVTERSYPGAMPLPKWLHWLRRKLYPSASVVVGQTHASASWLKTEIPAAQVCVIPNSFTLPSDSDQPYRPVESLSDRSKQLILGVGRLSPEKGFHDLVTAYALLSDQSRSASQLVILGEGSERPLLERHVHELGLSDHVVFPGATGNLTAWYLRADVFVLSSRFEGFPNALLEAQAHGVACVSFDCLSGPADLIDHDRTGLLVDPEAGSSGLAAAIEQLLTDSERRSAMGTAARQASARFETSQVITMWESLIEEVRHQATARCSSSQA